MSWDINQVMLVGRIGHTPELKYTPSGASVCKISLAVGGKPFNGQDVVYFFYANVWGQQAENLIKYCNKGDLIAVTGELVQRKWIGKDGSKKSENEINVQRVQYLKKKNSENHTTGNNTDSSSPDDSQGDSLPPDAAEMFKNWDNQY